MVGCSLCRLLVLHIKCVPHPPTPLHPTFPVCVYCNTLDRHGASCRHIRHNHNAASDSSCVPPILIPLTPLQPQPTKPSPIAVFVLATTVISPVCPPPLLLPCSHLHPSPNWQLPCKVTAAVLAVFVAIQPTHRTRPHGRT